MISHEYKLIFIHIPKCAGTSVEGALNHFTEFNGDGRQDHRSLRQLEPIKANSFLNIENNLEVARKIRYFFVSQPNPKNKYIVNSNEFNRYFKFTVIRNPWDRIISMYKNRHEHLDLNNLPLILELLMQWTFVIK